MTPSFIRLCPKLYARAGASRLAPVQIAQYMYMTPLRCCSKNAKTSLAIRTVSKPARLDGVSRLLSTSAVALNRNEAGKKHFDEILKAFETMNEDQRSTLVTALQKRHEQVKSVGKDATEAEEEEPKIPLPTLMVLGCMSAIPFIGFGFLDNALMLLAGDFIDHTVSIYLHTSVMASAAMGNVVSGAVGMQVHGMIDRVTQKLFLIPKEKNGSDSATNGAEGEAPAKPGPFDLSALTPEQMNSRSAFLAGHIGGTLGIILGLCLGMAPLLFLSPQQKPRPE